MNTKKAERPHAAHTPGPWQFLEVAGSNPVHYHIASASVNVGTFDGREADARLIAAAPELLAALKVMVTKVSFRDEYRFQNELKAARVVIAKAEGR